MENRVTRLVLAVFLAPLAIVPILTLLLLLTGSGTAESGSGFGYAVYLFSAIGLTVAYPAIIAIGLPAFFLLLHFDKTSLFAHGATGAILATLVSFPTLRLLFGGWVFSSNATILFYATIFVSCGIAVSVTFRKIAGLPIDTDDTNVHKAT